MQKILVIQTAFIGDVILGTGVVETLHRHYPQAAIDFLLRKGNEGLLAHHPFLRRTLVWDKREGKYRALLRILAQVRAERYDLVVNLQRFAATGLLTALSRAKTTVGFSKNPFSVFFTHRHPHHIDAQSHEIDRNHSLIASLTGPLAGRPRLYPSATDEAAVQPYLQEPYVCIAPASVWFTKQFPAHKWAALMRQIDERFAGRYRLLLLGSPADAPLCERIMAQAGTSRAQSLAGKLNFLQSAALMRRAAMNYVNDSAPLHIASAVDAPVCAVFCSTVPEFGFGPLASRSYVIETPDYGLECRPCGLHGHSRCPLGHFACAEQIDVARMVAVLEKNGGA